MSNPSTPLRPLGSSGLSVFPLALGCMGMSGMYGQADEGESIATIHAAQERGVTLFDTGDFYGNGHNEMLLGRALAGRREGALLSVKFGALRMPDGAFIGIDTRPVAVKNFLSHSLTRLGVDHIDIYRPARLDPAVPIEDTVGAIAELVQAGYVRHIGLSEVGVDTLRRAAAVHPIVDLQIEYSLVSRGIEAEILPTARELGVGFVPYSPLGRGFLSGQITSRAELEETDYRHQDPRFTDENFAKNLAIVDVLNEIGHLRGASAAQVALAWLLAQGDDVVPIPGCKRRVTLEDSAGASGLALSAAELARLDAAAPPGGTAGPRYAERYLRAVNL